MRRLSFQCALPCAIAACFLAVAAPAGAVTIDMVLVGNPGNANDTGGTNNGAVAYPYHIGAYDVTIGQYTAFLNAADPSGANPNGIWNSLMETDRNMAGISYSPGARNGSKYSAIGPFGAIQIPQATAANRPITYVSWFDAARFANWMANGQGSGSTENGAYDLATAPAGTAPARNLINPNTGAAPTFFIPTNDEWYKAAYYSPTKGGTGGYYTYATQSDVAPGNIIGSGTNQANWNTGNGYSVTQSSSYYEFNQNYLTDVGACSGSQSFYGTFDQSGNVFQWNDLDGLPDSFRGLRGGSWFSTFPVRLSSSVSVPLDPSFEDSAVGFRLASPVPEIDPSSMGSVLALIGGSLSLLERRRKRA